MEKTMNKIKQHKVGERFENCKLIYEVREDIICGNCSFYIKDENHCTKRQNQYFEPCNSFERDDNINVIFVQVGETKD